jgi:hypothetical protein
LRYASYWIHLSFLVGADQDELESETVGFCVSAYDQHGVISIGKFLSRCSKIPMERNKTARIRCKKGVGTKCRLP